MTTDARLSTGLPHHPKTRKLIRRLGESGAWHLVCLFLWVAQNRSDGELEGMDQEDIEIAAGWMGDEGAFFAALVDVRFISNGRLDTSMFKAARKPIRNFGRVCSKTCEWMEAVSNA